MFLWRCRKKIQELSSYANFNMGTEISILCFVYSAGGGNGGGENGTGKVAIVHGKNFLFFCLLN